MKMVVLKRHGLEEIKAPARATSCKTIMHLIATNFHGGQEKQVVEYLKRLDCSLYRGVLASFIEKGNPNETLERAEEEGISTCGIFMSGPLDLGALWALQRILSQQKVSLLCAHGYKFTVMGWWAGGKLGIPVISFSRGYTAENTKVAFYEWLERRILERLAGIICVSGGQRYKLESFGIQNEQIWVLQSLGRLQCSPASPFTRSSRREQSSSSRSIRRRSGVGGTTWKSGAQRRQTVL